MPSRSTALHSAAARPRARRARRLLALLRVLEFVSLLLLPMQMRAGADDPHPHAILELILDARDGVIDHHAPRGVVGDDVHGHAVESSTTSSYDPDIPTFGASSSAAGGMAILAAVVTLFIVPAAESRGAWPILSPWTGRSPALEPPPPRIESI